MNRPPAMLSRSILLAACTASLCFGAPSLRAAQAPEEFEFKGGRRIPVSSIKPAGEGFTAVIPLGNTTQTLNFTAKEVLRASFREPPGLMGARILTASGRSADSGEQLAKLCTELAPFQSVRGSWWHRAAILHMDALSMSGKLDEARALVDSDTLAKLPEEAAAAVSDFQLIIAKPAASPELKIADLEALAKRSSDPWLAARAWLEIGDILVSQNKLEDAVKAWLRVFVFHGAEPDLAVRGMLSAARGLQQLKLAEHGVKLLDDYLGDHIGSPYAAAIRAEMKKLDPKQQQ